MFKDREQAAMLLALKIDDFIRREKVKDPVIIALTRGAVGMGKIIADFLRVPFDAIVVKKIGHLLSPELAIGAIGPRDTIFWNKNFDINNLDKRNLRDKKKEERDFLDKLIHKNKEKIILKNKNIFLIDDGLATGASVICASLSLKKEKIRSIILAVPVAASDSLREVKKYFDDLLILREEKNFFAVGEFYRSFPEVTTGEVVKILNQK